MDPYVRQFFTKPYLSSGTYAYTVYRENPHSPGLDCMKHQCAYCMFSVIVKESSFLFTLQKVSSLNTCCMSRAYTQCDLRVCTILRQFSTKSQGWRLFGVCIVCSIHILLVYLRRALHRSISFPLAFFVLYLPRLLSDLSVLFISLRLGSPFLSRCRYHFLFFLILP